MTADEIRNACKDGFGDPVGNAESAQIFFTAEIAAQLAELNDHLAAIRAGKPLPIQLSKVL